VAFTAAGDTVAGDTAVVVAGIASPQPGTSTHHHVRLREGSLSTVMCASIKCRAVRFEGNALHT
jgi:hypothetical protein